MIYIGYITYFFIVMSILKESINSFLKSEEVKTNKTKTKSNIFRDTLNSITTSTIEFEYNEDELLIIFKDARILSLNKMMELLQKNTNRPYEMMAYKKAWHTKMSIVLKSIINDSIINDKKLPNFNTETWSLRLYLYREAQRLLDEDAMSASFKYIIDSLSDSIVIDDKNYKFIEDDNQNVISEILPFQVKSKQYNLAIKIVKIEKKPSINSLDEFLKII